MPRENGGKIRFVMFEMEGGSEQLAQGMQAIVSALRQPTTVVRNVTPASSALNGSSTQTQLEETDPIEEDEALAPISSVKKVTKKKTYYSPKVLADLDLNTADIPFETYCTQKNPKSTSKRYLVIAYWLKEYCGLSAVTQDHIYTCYRKMNWPGLKDYGDSFRYASKHGHGSITNGAFTINHIGKDVVDKMANGS